MVISFVCSRWRQNALSIPAIWSRISLYWDVREKAFDGNWEDEDMETVYPLSNFLNRSQQHPMVVDLDIAAGPFIYGRGLHPLLKQLVEQNVRWQSLSYYCEDYSFKDFLDCHDIPLASFPVLSRLCFPRSVMDEDLAPFINAAPNLQSLNLTDALLIPQFPADYNEVEIQNVFNKCSNLISLGLAESTLYGDGVAPVTIPSSSKLEMLTVRHHECWENLRDFSDSVFPLLRLPSLKVLHLVSEKYGSGLTDNDNNILPLRWGDHDVLYDNELETWSKLGPFLVFVQQSAFQLTTFSIQRLSISDANLVDILVLLPTLQDLTVDDSGISPKHSPISSEFIDSLHGCRTSSLRPQTAALVPRLRSLRLLNVAATSFEDLSVVEMIQSRWSPAKLYAVGTSAFEVDCLRVFTLTFLNRQSSAGHVYSSLWSIGNRMMIVIQMCGTVTRRSGKTLWV
ncbi:hypothetical protein BDP27DRAFT_1332274 [Rhodocollybia butyracea]|uniref:F-box domain-containing protein n=1 Tax=Rhodocollybia butyracea TaxID=206335 RepID=A0A9P5PKX3_9AGAR|nr:hypothetical protein BDP27DRAFT_1332274 [Rhodocollybia butyracea]